VKEMRQYDNGNLIASRLYSIEEQANHLLQEKIKIWEDTKIKEAKQIEAEIQQRKNTVEEEIAQKMKEEEAKALKRQEEIERERQKLEQMRIQFEEEKKKMEILEKAQEGWVKLNIGGTSLETSVSTLSKCDYFNSMFSGRYSVKKNSEGDFIVRIDRDGKYFDHILNFLRDGKLSVVPSSSVASALIVEAEYYGISQLVAVLKNK